jgi:hypothetical protein
MDRMNPAAPPAILRFTPEDEAAWRVVWPRAAAVEGFHPTIDSIALGLLVKSYTSYRRALAAIEVAGSDEERRILAEILSEDRRTARMAAVRMLLIPEREEALGLIDSAGRDIQLEALFALAD